MDKFLNNKYKLQRSENLNEMLKEMGINSMLRKLSSSMSTTVQLVRKNDDQYSLNSTILLMTTSQKFILNEEKDVTTLDGRKVKITFSIDGNKLIEKQMGEKSLVIIREFYEDELIVTSTIGEVVCKSWCKLLV